MSKQKAVAAHYNTKDELKNVVLPLFDSVPHGTADQLVQQAAFAVAVMQHGNGPTYGHNNQLLQVNDFAANGLTQANVAAVEQGPFQWGVAWYQGQTLPAGALTDSQFQDLCKKAGCSH